MTHITVIGPAWQGEPIDFEMDTPTSAARLAAGLALISTRLAAARRVSLVGGGVAPRRSEWLKGHPVGAKTIFTVWVTRKATRF
jgi:hypothetical protein